MGDALAVGSCSGTFYLLDKETGRPRWSYETGKDASGTAFHDDPLLAEDAILIGTDGQGKGHVYAFEQSTGSVRWMYEAGSDPNGRGGVRENMSRIGRTAYASTLDQRLVALDIKDGTPSWVFPVAEPGAPAVNLDHVFVSGAGGTVYCLDALSGSLAWKQVLPADVTTRLLPLDGGLYLGTAANRLYRIDEGTGDVVSEMALDGKPIFDLLPVRDSIVFSLDTGGKPNEGDVLVSVDLALSEIRWRQDAPGGWWAQHRVWSDLVITGDREGKVIAYDAAHGAKRWSETVKGTIRTIGASEDVAYFGTFEGTVYAYRRR